MSGSRLDRVRIVLYEPQDPVNIGATVRAMKNMGVATLHLVRPVAYDPERIEGIAHNTRDLIDRIVLFDDFDAAVADCVRVVGFTARRRAARRAMTAPREEARSALEAAEQGPVAYVFGREDSGLPNEILDRMHALVMIPTTAHASLNLAQAVLVGLYELHLAAADATRALAPSRKAAPPPTNAQFEQYFGDLERSLDAIEFFKTRVSEHIMRTLRSLTYRAAPDARELSLVRAMTLEVVNYLKRTGRP
ncbi:MAG: TrmJ/YjtD family RNA methyltransferase [Gemmatimonadota bacterium]|nr:TrmJ/YjtD family RNA methyltransferase [Gemmatimonadota bacterium]MDE3127737.1 TrmJ/YjtD family RNA methyltransferase [Gemmatimonadota bacterium]MDE3172773.1 TrmJ/YjtD family RNA methyltransferase [Gemmatimonadota bacterium]MDE3215827.1 TrmJ/YjtD family RNA methyltransferase [Gemmatimonadota bacterium]